MANLTTQNDYIFNIDTSLSMNQLIAVAGTNTYKVQSRYKLYNDRFVAATQYSYLFWFIYGGAVSLLGVKR